MKTKQAATLRFLAESALMIALATVLSLIKIIDMPYGGSVTIASALPIAIIAYRYGLARGLFTATVYAAIQQILGLSMLSYVTTWQSIVAVILLDYIVAFAVIGFAGVFRKAVKNQATAITLGCLVVSIARYACHVVSGATVWAGLSIPTQAALAYSFAYNATYMLPETIILLVCAVYVASNVDFTSATPSRVKGEKSVGNQAWIAPTAGLIAVVAAVADTALVFQHIQDEDGNFVVEGFALVNWTLVIAITAVAVLIVGALIAIKAATAKNTKK